MFAAFSADEKKLTARMNGITGAVISLLILVIDISYLVSSHRLRQKQAVADKM